MRYGILDNVRMEMILSYIKMDWYITIVLYKISTPLQRTGM